MDSNCHQTLEALQIFGQAQKRLLAQTKYDLERLRELRQSGRVDPRVISDLPRLSDYCESAQPLPAGIDWSVFTFKDPALLKRVLDRQGRETPRTVPQAQLSKPSQLQNFVRVSRRTIVDPILAECALHSDPEPDSEEEIDPETLQRQREHQKIRDLKQRVVRSCGLTIHAQSASAVFIRHDMEDESGEVNIAAEEEVNHPPSPALPPPPPPIQEAPSLSRPTRPRKQPLKSKSPRHFQGKTLHSKKMPPSLYGHSPPPPQDTKPARGSGKPKSETYKLAWTDSEQNLLERLLEEIPDGSKNRWAKISRAMNGRRTPKQVASRVQKYFEKLKRFGVG